VTNSGENEDVHSSWKGKIENLLSECVKELAQIDGSLSLSDSTAHPAGYHVALNMMMSYGELLSIWPDLIEEIKILKAKGTTIGKKV